MQPRNDHIQNYLTYFVNLARPGFATLVDGPWGSGKTFQVKKFLETNGYNHPKLSDLGFWEKRKRKSSLKEKTYIYVSLYGVSTIDQIDREIVSAIYPWLSKDGVKFGTAVGRAVAKTLNFDVSEINLNKLLLSNNSDILVFDDLERAGLPASEALGYINSIVDRDGSRVVVIANTSEIDDTRFPIVKEKVFGQTLFTFTDFSDAYDLFCKRDDLEFATSYLTYLKPHINNVFDQSGINNLRILSRSLADLGRLISILPDWLLANSEAMTHLTVLFCAFSFECKAGRLNEGDLRNRIDQITVGFIQEREEKEGNPLHQSSKKYQNISLGDEIFSDRILVDMLIKGRFSKEEIQNWLNQSSWREQRDGEKSWKTVWQSYERDDTEVEAAQAQMLREFYDGSVKQAGDLLHIFGQIISLIKDGIITQSFEEALFSAKNVIVKLRENRHLEPLYNEDESRFGFDSFDGFGFAERDNPLFIEFKEYLNEQRRLAATDLLPEKASTLFNILNKNPSDFCESITGNSNDRSFPYRLPILTYIDAGSFADFLLQCSPAVLREVLIAIQARYDSGFRLADQDKELAWLKEMRSVLFFKLGSLSPTQAARVRQNAQWTIDKVINARQASTESA